MTDRPDPLSPSRIDASSQLGRMLGAARSDPGLDPEALERVVKRAAAPPPTPPLSPLQVAALGLGVLALVGAIGAGVWGARPAPTPQDPITAPAPPLASTAPVRAEAPDEREIAAEPAPEPQAAPASIDTPEEVVARATRPARPAPPEPVAEEPPSEGALLLRARTALRHDAARALAIAEEHRVAYPEGTMRAEREVLAIEALTRLGRWDAAEQRAARFDERYPTSPYRGRVEAALSRRPAH